MGNEAGRRTLRSRDGFTLVELLVVLGIFSTVVVSASDIFLLVSRAQRKVYALERTQADARYTMEAISREIRTGRIDYAAYGGTVTSPADTLRLLDIDKTPIVFRRSAADESSLCADTASVPCLVVLIGLNAPVAVTPKGVIARNLQFYVEPGVDPLTFDPATGGYAADTQPFVTVVLSLEGASNQAGERSPVNVQTTITTRDYRR